MTSVEPIDVLDLFTEERASLLHLLSALSDDEWTAPTVCPGWTVKDIALHLLGVDVGNISRRRDNFHGAGMQRPAGETWEDLVEFLNHFNQSWVEATRRISPRLLCELLAVTGPALVDYVRNLDLNALGGAVVWAGAELAPVWLDVAREYTERWVHQQQIRDALGRPGITEPRYLAPVLAALAHGLPRALASVAAAPGTRVRLVVTGPSGGAWTALRTDDRWRLGQDDGTTDAATVTIDANTAWRLFTKGITPDQALPRVQTAGDRALAEAVLETVSIIA